MSSCDKTKRLVTQIELFDQLSEKQSEEDLRDMFGVDKEEFDKLGTDILDTEKPINETTLNEVLNKRYGRHEEGLKITNKILALVNANESIRNLDSELDNYTVSFIFK